MPTTIFTTMTSEHVIIFCKNPKPILNIVMYISEKLLWVWKTYSLCHSNSIIDILKTIRTQATPCCFLKEGKSRRFQLHRLALTYLNCISVAIKMLSAAFASYGLSFIRHHTLRNR
jgi:hypothetical protein